MVEEDSEYVFNVVFYDVIFLCLVSMHSVFVFSDSQPTKLPQVKPVLMFVFNGKRFIRFYPVFIVNPQFYNVY